MLCIVLLAKGEWELRIDLRLTNGTIIYLPYKQFAVGPASEQYPLTISGFTGYTTDPFNSHLTTTSHYSALNTMKFTTRDRDNDLWPHNCAIPAQRSGISGTWVVVPNLFRYISKQSNTTINMEYYSMVNIIPYHLWR